MHTLTRHALSAFVRWQQNDPRGRRAMEEAGQVHPAEAAALLQLERNLHAHPPAAWFREAAATSWHGLVRADAAEAIMADLCLRDDVTMALLAQVLPGLAMPRRFLLRQALDKWLETHPERVVTKTRQEDDMSKSTEAVARVVDRYPGILEMAIPFHAKERLAAEAGTTLNTISTYLAPMREKAGIQANRLRPWSPPPGWRKDATEEDLAEHARQRGAEAAGYLPPPAIPASDTQPVASTPLAPAAVPGEPEAAGGAAAAVSEQVSEALEQDMGEGWRLTSTTPATGYAEVHASGGIVESGAANGHVELTPADRQFALQLAAGVGNADDLAELDLPRRRAVLELAARAVTLAAG